MLGYCKADHGNRSLYLNNNIWQWTAELERSFGQDFVTGIAYVGQRGPQHRMPVMNLNNPDPGLGAVQGRRPVQSYVDSRAPSVLLPLGTVRRLETDGIELQRAPAARRKALLARPDLPRLVQLSRRRCPSATESMKAGLRELLTQDPRNRLAD